MNDFLNNLNLPFFNNSKNDNNCFNDLDINKLLVIILLLTGNLTIEAITVYPHDFAVTLGTFKIE